MHGRRFVGTMLALAALAGCGKDSVRRPTGTVTPPVAYVRCFNAVGDTLALDFRAIDEVVRSQPFLAVPFRGIGSGYYQAYQAGSRRIRVVPSSADLATNSSILVDTALTLNAGASYTVVHTGFARAGRLPKQGLRVVEDTLPTPGGDVALRIIHAGPNVEAVDLYITSRESAPLPDSPTFADVTYGTVQSYKLRMPGAIVIRGYADAAVTVFTAMLFGAATPGSVALVTAGRGVNSTPTLSFWIDKVPPGIAPWHCGGKVASKPHVHVPRRRNVNES